MREIKFRAWDGEKMHSPGDYWLSADGHAAIFDKEGMIAYCDWKLIQYTGLKDKNGKDIYESDIMEWEYYPNLPTTRGMGSFVKRGVVTWFPTHTHFSIKTNEGTPYSVNLGGSAIKRQEVIGNIYENPELMEDVK